VDGHDPSSARSAGDEEPFGTVAGDGEGSSGPDEDSTGDLDPYRSDNSDNSDLFPSPPPPSRMDSWRKRSATGAILTGIALGLQNTFQPKEDDPAIIQEATGDPPDDLPVEADFEFRRPKQSVVNIRPWLLNGADTAARSGGDAPTAGEPAVAKAAGNEEEGDRR